MIRRYHHSGNMKTTDLWVVVNPLAPRLVELPYGQLVSSNGLLPRCDTLLAKMVKLHCSFENMGNVMVFSVSLFRSPDKEYENPCCGASRRPPPANYEPRRI